MVAALYLSFTAIMIYSSRLVGHVYDVTVSIDYEVCMYPSRLRCDLFFILGTLRLRRGGFMKDR